MLFHATDESSRWLDQHFCRNCGTNIGFTLEAVPDIRTTAVGTFDDPSWVHSENTQTRHVFTRSARKWASIPNDAERYERQFR